MNLFPWECESPPSSCLGVTSNCCHHTLSPSLGRFTLRNLAAKKIAPAAMWWGLNCRHSEVRRLHNPSPLPQPFSLATHMLITHVLLEHRLTRQISKENNMTVSKMTNTYWRLLQRKYEVSRVQKTSGHHYKHNCCSMYQQSDELKLNNPVLLNYHLRYSKQPEESHLESLFNLLLENWLRENMKTKFCRQHRYAGKVKRCRGPCMHREG